MKYNQQIRLTDKEIQALLKAAETAYPIRGPGTGTWPRDLQRAMDKIFRSQWPREKNGVPVGGR